MPGRRSALDALQTREAILRRAADVASVEGLEGLTIGRLAADLGMSKSGVIGQFGSKEELQLATLDLGARIFTERVWEPARHVEPGLPRLLAICEAWTRYGEAPGFPGGCFIAAALYEWDGREGPVHDALAELMRRWRAQLVEDAEIAVRNGDLPPETDAEQVAFSLEALASGMNPARQLYRDERAADWSLQAMRAVLRLPAVA
jgi:AcrR family transcriptional regulator